MEELESLEKLKKKKKKKINTCFNCGLIARNLRRYKQIYLCKACFKCRK